MSIVASTRVEREALPLGGALEQLVAELSGISGNLLESYGRLAQHAQRVEGELVVANAELARRVAEVDALRSHLDAVRRALPCGVVVLRADGAVASANPRSLELLDATEPELVAQRGGDVVRAATRAETVHEVGGATRRVLAVRRSEIPGGCGGSVVTIDDRTEERRLAGELAARSKMAALGTMAGGIAHEVRNPLNAVRGFAALLRRELEGTSRAHRFACRIEQAVDEVDAIVKSILGFASPERLVREELDAAQLVEEGVALARAELEPLTRDRWTIETRIDVERVRADRIKLRQALRNLVANAVQAQPDGGRVVVEIGEHRGAVELRVHDAGPGLATSMHGRAGEPFLTTRAAGTGLGLALVHAVAVAHGGDFEILPAPGPLGGADARLRIQKH